MERKFLILSVVLLYFNCLKLNAQQPAPKDLNKVVLGLHDYIAGRPQEKIHIHFDKPFYSVGDTIWFKAYLVNVSGNKLSSISKVMYIDVLAPNGVSKQMVLPVNAGMAAAQLVLADSLYTAGDYPLRAYTQWMRNTGEEYFFTHTLRVGNVLQYKANASASFRESTQGLTAEITYTNTKGVALSAQEVNYRLKKGDKVFSSGKMTINTEGKAGVVFPANKLPKGEALVLEANTLLSSGAVLTNRFVVSTTNDKLDLHFFPEGGDLVAGIRSKIAFKAMGRDGLGLEVRGYIENEQGEQVAAFQTGRFGMGIFPLLPQTGNSYTAVVTQGDSLQRFALPKALAEGYVLSVNSNEAGDFMVRINRTITESQTEVLLVVQSAGEVKHALKLPINSPSITYTLAKSTLDAGINQLTLFSVDNKPLAERLVFVRQPQAPAALESDKSEYAMRDLIKLRFDNGLSLVGGYSVAVVKADKVTLPEEKQLSIYANLLLSSELKGYIEDPNYYFTEPNAGKEAELDALLLTQGWRRFNWSEVLSEKVASPKYKAEQGLQISGKVVTSIGGKPVPGAKIKLLATKEILFLDTVANTDGRFSFNDLQLGDRVEVMLRASGAKASNNVKIILDEIEEMNSLIVKEDPSTVSQAADTAMKVYLAQTSRLFDEMERTGKIIQGTTLKTVEIFTKKKPPEIKGSVYPFAATPPDYTFEPDKLQEMVNLESYLWGLNGVLVKGKEIWGYCSYCSILAKVGPMALLLNGSPIDDLSGINPRSLTGVQIIRGSIASQNMATSLMLPLGSTKYGIVFLTMKGIPEKFIKPNRPPGFLQYQMLGYTYAREFYVPNYELLKDGSRSDFRSTLFWKPDIVTAADGKAEFSFFASDEPGQYRVTLEGIGVNGQLCRKISYFEVKEIL